jgi:hypothetical protein
MCVLTLERDTRVVNGAASWTVKPPAGTALNGSSSLTNGLVALWHINQNNVPTNLVNAALSGTYDGAPSIRPTQDGYGVTSLADADYMVVTDPNNTLNFTTGPFSIEIDFYYGTPAPGMVLLGRDYFAVDGYNIQTANDGVGRRIAVEMNHGPTYDVYQTAQELQFGAINRVLVTYSGSIATIYINGVSGWEFGASGAYSPPTLGLHDLFIGRDASFSGTSFKNPITRVAMWNRALTTSEALQVNNSDPYSYMAPPTVTQPAISSVSAGSVTATAALVTWATNIPANSQVQYGPTLGYGSLSTLDGTLLTSHSVSLAGLTPGTQYHYQVVSTDSTGALVASADNIFTTLPAPRVTAVTPVNGAAAVSQTTTVTATFSGAMTASSINSNTMVLQAGITPVPATVSFNAATVVATLTPSAPLAGTTTYTATVKSGGSGVKDAAGNPMVADFVWSFTTGPDVIPPTVTAVSPLNGAIGVAPTTTVTATFSEAVATASVSATTVLLAGPGGAAVPAAVSYSAATRTATLTPSAALANLTTYTATVKGGAAGVKDLAGNALSSDVVWTFTTAGAGGGPLTIDAVAFGDRSTGSTTATTSAFSTAAANELLLAFVAADEPPPFTTNTSVTGVAGGGLTWQLVVATNVQAGTAEIWRAFATTTLSNVSVTATLSQAAASSLTVVSVMNANPSGTNGSGAIGAIQSANAGSGAPTASLTTTKSGSWVFGVGDDWDTATARTVGANQTMVHQYLATIGDTYWVQRMNTPTPSVGTNVTINDTAPSGDRYNLSLVEILPSGVDTTPPTVTAVTPVSGSSTNNVLPPVTATFSETMAAATISASTVLLKGPGGTAIGATVAYNAATTTATLTPSAALTSGTLYTATVKGGAGGVTDVAGNPLAADVTWTFTVDTTAPTVTAVTPTAGSTINNPATTVTAIFSKAMTAASISATAVLLTGPGATAVPATVTYNAGTQTAALTPTAALTNGTLYTATIKSGAGGVKDLAGNTLTADVVWTFTVDTTAPTVTAVSPLAGATINNITPAVTVTFSEAVNGVSGTTVLLTGPGGAVAATVGYAPATHVATLTPTTALTSGALYTVTVKSGASGVTDVAGNPLASDFTSTFTVDTTPPTVTAVSPANGALTTVTTVTATFSEAVTAVSGTTMTLTGPGGPVAATVTYNAATHVATLTPTAALTSGTLYTATVKGGASGVTDLAGNPLAADVTWTFTNDTTAPTVTAVSPINGAFINNATPPVTATFSKPMSTGTIGTSTMLLTGPGGAVAATVAYNPATTTATLTPTAALTSATLYTATVKSGAAGVKDLAGNSLTADVTWTFTVDTTAPTVTAISPVGGGTTNNLTPTVTITFSEAVNGVSGTTVLLNAPGPAAVLATVTYSPATHVATLTPTAALTSGTVYTVTVKGGPSGVTDVAGNPLASDFTSTFTVDTTAPTVTAFSPANGAITNVTTVTATFSEAVTGVSGATVLLTGPGGAVAATVTYAPATMTATLTPTAALTSGTLYTATVKSGAAGVKDLAGNPLVADVTWTFTVDTTAPTVTAVSPVAGATINNLTPSVTVTFSEAVNGVSGTTVLLTGPGGAVAATVSYAPATHVATLTPTTALTSGALYTVTVKSGASGVTDVAGNPLASDFTSTFTVDTTPPTVTTVSPLAGAVNVASNTTVTATFSEAMAAATINGAAFTLTGPGTTAVAATVSYAAATRTATLTPTAALAAGTLYTATIKSGATGVTDLAGNPMAADFSWTFTTGACPCSIWTTSTTPGSEDGDTGAVELGMKFTSDVAGTVTGLRFYKYAENTGTHVGNLWSVGGTLLGTVTFSGETASGWQTATFTTPIAIVANTTYVISYHTSVGRYASTENGFATAIDRAPLHAPSSAASGGNGVYLYGAGSGFPNQTWNGSNYWVDVIFKP